MQSTIRMGIDEQVVQLEILRKIAEPIVEDAHVLALAKYSGNISSLHARRNEEERTARSYWSAARND